MPRASDSLEAHVHGKEVGRLRAMAYHRASKERRVGDKHLMELDSPFVVPGVVRARRRVPDTMADAATEAHRMVPGSQKALGSH